MSLQFSFEILTLFYFSLNEKKLFLYLSDIASLFLCFPLQCHVISLLPHSIFNIIPSYNGLALDRGLWKHSKTPPSFSLIFFHCQTTAKRHHTINKDKVMHTQEDPKCLGFFPSVSGQKDILIIPDLYDRKLSIIQIQKFFSNS